MTTTNHTPRTRHPGARRSAAAASALCLLAAACSSKPAADPGSRTVTEEVRQGLDRDAVRDPIADQARNAILRERTIREMHFEPASARLTSLGRKNLKVLAGALRAEGGTVNVQRGSADAALYAARVAEVRAQLVAAGIAADRFALEDGAAGGPGMPTGEALRIRDEIRKTSLPSATGTVLDPRAGTTGASNGGTP